MKIDRLLGIVTALLQQEAVTAPQLAQRFEVSRRTINRDIDALCRAGIPVVARQGAGGGFSIAEGFKIDKNVLTGEELDNLITALKGLDSVSENAQTSKLIHKLAPGNEVMVSLKDSIVINLASFYKGSLAPKIALLKRAIREQTVVAFDYHYDKGISQRRIEPMVVFFEHTAWYVFGYCLLRNDWRVFRLGRLWALSLCDERFTPREIPDEKAGHNYINLPDDKHMTVLFDASVAYQLAETYGPDCYTVQPDGRLRLELGYTNQAYMRQWLLGFGDKAVILEPCELAEELKATALRMAALYGE